MLKECKHEIDPGSIAYNKKYGREGVCKLCGVKLLQFRYAKLNQGKVRMSKKERLRQRRGAKEVQNVED